MLYTFLFTNKTFMTSTEYRSKAKNQRSKQQGPYRDTITMEKGIFLILFLTSHLYSYLQLHPRHLTFLIILKTGEEKQPSLMMF